MIEMNLFAASQGQPMAKLFQAKRFGESGQVQFIGV